MKQGLGDRSYNDVVPLKGSRVDSFPKKIREHTEGSNIRLPCSYCGKMFTKCREIYEHDSERQEKFYCSRSCSTSANNKRRKGKRLNSTKSGPEDLMVLLRTFKVLEESGSFTVAARNLHLSNETATMYRLKALEKYCGVKLFTRVRGGHSQRRLLLTPHGKYLYDKLEAGEWMGEHTQKSGLQKMSEL